MRSFFENRYTFFSNPPKKTIQSLNPKRANILSALSALSAGIVLSFAGGCSPSTSSAEMPEVTPAPAAAQAIAPAEEPTPAPAPPSAEQLLSEATTQAEQASALAQSAQSRDDWALVASLWAEAIAQLDRIPEGAPERATAQQNKATYAANLSAAQQAANQPVDTTPRLHSPRPPSEESPDGEAPAETNSADSATPTPADTPDAQANVSAEVALASHLAQSGARMYATYWCSYCERQQQLFGEEAVQQLEVIECDPRGENPQVDRCRAANVSSFPTWEINGRQYSGLQSLSRLADLSGYNGPHTFSD